MTAVEPAPSRSYPWYLLLLVVLAGALVAAVGAVNYRLNPLVYDRQYIRRVASELDAGRNFANYDPNLNWRALRREEIRQWTSTPDVIVFGGSRWWEAHQDMVPGKTFKNMWVSNDQAEDAMALTYLLEQAGRLPKTMILSLRFISFQPPAARDTPEWQEWAPEYRAMARRLDIAPHSYLQSVPIRAWSSMFYAPGAYDRAQQVSKVAAKPGPTSDMQQQSLEILASDGSVYWSRTSESKFTKKFVDKAVAGELRRIGNTAPAIDASLVDAFAKTVRYLQSKGVRVVLAQTPYHPTFWNTIKSRPFGKLLLRLQSIAEEMADRYGVLSVGGYDPQPIGCTADQYLDQIHPRPACVSKVLALIPDL
jgi:hypothetical protein